MLGRIRCKGRKKLKSIQQETMQMQNRMEQNKQTTSSTGMVRLGVLLVTILLVVNVSSYAQYDAKAKGILDKVALKYEKMKGYSASFSHRMRSPANEIDETQKGDIKVSGGKFWLTLQGQDIIVDGKTMWTIMKEDDECEATIMDYEPEEGEVTPQNIYSMYKKGYKYVYNQEVVENGEKYHIIDLSPEDKDAEIFKIRIRIQKSTNTIASWQMFEKSGNRYVYTIKGFKEQQSFPSGTFRFDKSKYPKCDINDMR